MLREWTLYKQMGNWYVQRTLNGVREEYKMLGDPDDPRRCFINLRLVRRMATIV
jgi:hypothetical protein